VDVRASSPTVAPLLCRAVAAARIPRAPSVAVPTMSYRILARKYRPRTFAEVIGQDHIVTALSRAIEKKRLGQAYMLVGPRGTGKTSTARILAKTLNCEKGESITPCLECDPCLEIERGNNPDVIEIDGASNNGVDDVRALRERVHYRPLRDRHKIYILDEVQRLSGPAFDALLKTLEEPPDHALFVFATTDPHKIPDTIVSRCQVFEFRRLREVDIQSKLTSICEWEKIDVPAEVLAALARGCRGGLRDAESMLDQVLAVADGAPTLDDLEMIAGLARPERWLDIFEAVARDDGAGVLRGVEEFLQRGGTERDFVQQAVDALRDLLHLVLLGEDSIGVEPAPDRRQRSLDLAGRLGRDRLEAMLGMFFSLESKINRSPLAARALLEWTLLRAARLQTLMDTAALLRGIRSGHLPAPALQAASAPGSPIAPIVQASPTAPASASPTAPASASPTAPASASPPAPPPAPPPAIAATAAKPTGGTPAVAPPSPVAAAPSAPASVAPASATPTADPVTPPAAQMAATAAQPVDPAPQPAASATFPELLEKVRLGRPTAGQVISNLLIKGTVHTDHLQLILQPAEGSDRAILDDPVLHKWLARLPGGPGPWEIEYFHEIVAPDSTGDLLREGFDGREELP
jgi:DNA polymerase III subunit gamma/tau